MAVTDDIVAVLKEVQQRVDKANGAVNKIEKAIDVIKKEYAFYSSNKKIGSVYAKKGQDLFKKFDSLAKELGVPVKGSEPDKNIAKILDFAKQLDDIVGNMSQGIASLPK